MTIIPYRFVSPLFLRTKPVSSQEWPSILNHRARLLSRYLSSMDLMRLGNVRCLLTNGGKSHTLRDDPSAIIESPKDISLDTLGIFRPQVSKKTIPDSFLIWGLTSIGEWLLIRVQFKIEQRRYAHRTGRMSYQRATRIHITRETIENILTQTQEDPRSIWLELGQLAKKSVGLREYQFKILTALTQIIHLEEEVFHVLEEKDPRNRP